MLETLYEGWSSLLSWISSLTLLLLEAYLNSTMSIDRETFENTSEEELEELSVPDQVLGFLAAHENHAFKAREIASQVGLDEGSVSTMLSRLERPWSGRTQGNVLGSD